MSASAEPIAIDGGVLEGGGQILRVAVSLSALLKKPIRVFNIRAGRSKPGLRPQHLTGLCLVQDLCKGNLKGGFIGSCEITFEPGNLSHGSFIADTKTAGSTGLLIQVALPCMLYGTGPAKVVLKGGTNAEMAPQIDYTSMVFMPIAQKFGCKFDAKIIKRGYYPRGGGEVHIITVPIHQLKAVEMLEFGKIKKIYCRAFVAGVLPIKMAQTMADSATAFIKRTYNNIEIESQPIKEPADVAVGNGSGIIIVAETTTGCIIGASALGKKEISPREVGELAANDLIENLKYESCIDSNLQDQIIILMALAKGLSKVKCGKLTLHTQTAIHVTQLLTTAKFNVIENKFDETVIIECEGIGLTGNFNPSIHRQECCIPPNAPHP